MPILGNVMAYTNSTGKLDARVSKSLWSEPAKLAEQPALPIFFPAIATPPAREELVPTFELSDGRVYASTTIYDNRCIATTNNRREFGYLRNNEYTNFLPYAAFAEHLNLTDLPVGGAPLAPTEYAALLPYIESLDIGNDSPATAVANQRDFTMRVLFADIICWRRQITAEYPEAVEYFDALERRARRVTFFGVWDDLVKEYWPNRATHKPYVPGNSIVPRTTIIVLPSTAAVRAWAALAARGVIIIPCIESWSHQANWTPPPLNGHGANKCGDLFGLERTGHHLLEVSIGISLHGVSNWDLAFTGGYHYTCEESSKNEESSGADSFDAFASALVDAMRATAAVHRNRRTPLVEYWLATAHNLIFDTATQTRWRASIIDRHFTLNKMPSPQATLIQGA